MRTHQLKTWPSHFADVREGRKTFELRFNDRDYSVGDTLLLEEWDPAPELYAPKGYTGQKTLVEVTSILHGGTFGLPVKMCVMSVRIVRLVV